MFLEEVAMLHPPVASNQPPLQARPLFGCGQRVRRRNSCRTAQRLCDVAALATAAALAVPVDELFATSRRSRTTAFARQSAMYLAHVAFGLSLSEVGRAFGRDRTTAAHACRLIEDRRDEPPVDALLGALEDACGVLRQRLSAPVRP
jgi:hypothetical protein